MAWREKRTWCRIMRTRTTIPTVTSLMKSWRRIQRCALISLTVNDVRADGGMVQANTGEKTVDEMLDLQTPIEPTHDGLPNLIRKAMHHPHLTSPMATRKRTKSANEPTFKLEYGKPTFERNRCSIIIKHGNPCVLHHALKGATILMGRTANKRRKKRSGRGRTLSRPI